MKRCPLIIAQIILLLYSYKCFAQELIFGSLENASSEIALKGKAKNYLKRQELPTLEQILAEFRQRIVSAKDEDDFEDAFWDYDDYKRELFASPQSLFEKFTPGARTLCTVVFPEFKSSKVELFINYIIDQTNESLEFYFGKKVSDLSLFEIDVLLRETLIFIEYFDSRKDLSIKSNAYSRLKALRLDYLFFKSYVILLKGQLKFADINLIEGLVKQIKMYIQSLIKTKYEQYYRKRLEMLELALAKASEEVSL